MAKKRSVTTSFAPPQISKTAKSKKLETKATRRANNANLNAQVGESNSKKAQDKRNFAKVISAVDKAGLSFITFDSDEWKKLVEATPDAGDIVMDEIYLTDPDDPLNVVINSVTGDKITFNDGLAYVAGKKVAQGQRGATMSSRTNVYGDKEPQQIIDELASIAETDPMMVDVERKNRLKVDSFDRPALGDWIQTVTSWYKPIVDKSNRYALALGSRLFLEKIRILFSEVFDKYGVDGPIEKVDGTEATNDEYYLKPLSFDDAFDQTTKGKHFGYPYFTSQWTGDDNADEKSRLINKDLYDRAQKAIQEKTWFDNVEPIAILFSRIARGKIRMVLCPPKENAVIGRFLVGNLIPVFQESKQFAGFTGGENVGELIYESMYKHLFGSEADMEAHDEHVKLVMPYAVAVLARMLKPEYAEAFLSWINHTAKTGILTGYGIVVPKTADQLFGIVSGDTFTSILGGIAAALAFEYANVVRFFEGEITDDESANLLDQWGKCGDTEADDLVVSKAAYDAAKLNIVPDEQRTFKNFSGNDLTIKFNAFADLGIDHSIKQGGQFTEADGDTIMILLTEKLAYWGKTHEEIQNLCKNQFANPIVFGRPKSWDGAGHEIDILIEILLCCQDYDLYTYGDDAALMSNFDPEPMYKTIEELGMVINLEKSNTHMNCFKGKKTDDCLPWRDTSYRLSFLGWHYFQQDAVRHNEGYKVSGKVSIMRTLASKLIWHERNTYETNSNDFKAIAQQLADNQRIELTAYDLESALGTAMKLNLAAGNTCFSDLVKYVRNGSLLKLHSSLIISMEKLAYAEIVRDTMRISRKQLDKGLASFAIVAELHRQETEEGLDTLEPVIDGMAPSVDDAYAEAMGLTRPEITVITKEDAKFISQSAAKKIIKRAQSSNNNGKNGPRKVKQVTPQTSRVMNSLEKTFSAHEDVLKELETLLERAGEEAPKSEHRKLIVEALGYRKIMFGSPDKQSESDNMRDRIKAAIKSGEANHAYLDMYEALLGDIVKVIDDIQVAFRSRYA